MHAGIHGVGTVGVWLGNFLGKPGRGKHAHGRSRCPARAECCAANLVARGRPDASRPGAQRRAAASVVRIPGPEAAGGIAATAACDRNGRPHRAAALVCRWLAARCDRCGRPRRPLGRCSGRSSAADTRLSAATAPVAVQPSLFMYNERAAVVCGLWGCRLAGCRLQAAGSATLQ